MHRCCCATAGPTTVEFDGVAATQVTVVSSKRITGTIPVGVQGLVTVTVTNGGATYTLTDSYRGL